MDAWIAVAVGKMHINHISQSMLAEKMNVGKDYVWAILNGKKSPKNAEQRVMNAINELCTEKS